jgi:hypothetical protein
LVATGSSTNSAVAIPNITFDNTDLVFQTVTSGTNSIIKFNNSIGAHSGFSVYEAGGGGSFPAFGTNFYLNSGVRDRYNDSIGSSGVLFRPTGVIQWYGGTASTDPVLRMTLGTNGRLTTTGSNSFMESSEGFIKTGGASTQFLKANGSLDSNTYVTTNTTQTITGQKDFNTETYTSFSNTNSSLGIHIGASSSMSSSAIHSEIMVGNTPLIAGSLNIQPRGGGIGFVSFWNDAQEDIRITASGKLRISGSGDAQFRVDIHNGTIGIKEQSSADSPVSSKGQIWVKNTTPNTLWFTDDAGTDFQIS